MSAGSLYALAPLGLEDAAVESLTSYIARLAYAHQWPVRTLFKYMDDACGTRYYQSADRLVRRDGRALNGYGQTQAHATAALTRLTKQDGIAQCSLSVLKPVLASNGSRALKRYRHWCPACFEERRTAGEVPYDHLAWQIASLQICPVHQQPLIDRCPACEQRQHVIAFCHVDICANCYAQLWPGPVPGVEIDNVQKPYQAWLAAEITRLLDERSSLAGILAGVEFGHFLAELGRSRGLTSDDLAAYIHVPADTIQRWIGDRTRPYLESIFKVCANISTSPVRVLQDPLLAANQLELPFPKARIYRPTRPKPVMRHSREQIIGTLDSELRKAGGALRSGDELAKELNCCISMLYYHAPEQTKELGRRRRQSNQSKRWSFINNRIKSGVRIVRRWQNEGRPITREAFVQELVIRSKAQRCSEHLAKELFPVVLRHLNGSEISQGSNSG